MPTTHRDGLSQFGSLADWSDSSRGAIRIFTSLHRSFSEVVLLPCVILLLSQAGIRRTLPPSDGSRCSGSSAPPCNFSVRSKWSCIFGRVCCALAANGLGRPLGFGHPAGIGLKRGAKRCLGDEVRVG